ncbi:MAG: HEAT repeat domain-containing protein [Planctomycetes bacterium]|nr:HEAT repeat domain-containing protein [Planctomycetota bacterium]
MKPSTVGLLCIACSFAAAGLTFVLFESSRPAPSAPQVSHAEDSKDSERVALLEERVDALNSKLDDALKLQRDTVIVREASTGDAARGPVEDTTPAPKSETDPAKLKELAERLEEIESGESAARAMRDKAIIQLNSGDGREQAEAARLLGQLAMGGDEAAKKALREAMKSEDPDVREWAVEGLNDTGLVEFIDDLKLLMNDPEPDVREEVTQTLESMPADQAGPLLVSMLNDAESDVLVGAIEVLGDLKYTNAVADLLPLTRHADEEVSIAAAIAMRQCGDSSVAETWVPTLGARVSSESADERRRALRNLRHMNLESARPYIEQALEDPDRRVRREAERAIEKLNGN